MKNHIVLFLLGLLAFTPKGWSQESENTLENQFTDVIDKSNRYQDYKVVKIYKLNELQKNVMDSIAVLESTIGSHAATIEQLQGKIDSLQQQATQLTADLAASKKKEDGMEFFGSIIKKSTYQIILWSIIGILVLMAVVLFLRFKNSNAVTKVANTKLTETEEEFEAHRQRALEREQQLRRKLQDEINKQKNT